MGNTELKYKFNHFVRKHGKKFLILTSVFLLIGLASIVLGFGLSDGWDKVLAWFGSKYAWYCYIAALIWVFVVVVGVHLYKMDKSSGGK